MTLWLRDLTKSSGKLKPYLPHHDYQTWGDPTDKVTWQLDPSPTQDVNWTYIRRSEDVQDIFGTSYVRSIYVLCLRGHAVSRNHVSKWNNYISTTTVVPMANKLGRRVTYLSFILRYWACALFRAVAASFSVVRFDWCCYQIWSRKTACV